MTDKETRPGVASGAGLEGKAERGASSVSVPDPTDMAERAGREARRPCRVCRRRTRPVVPVGCAAGWDMCYRCYHGVVALRRHSEPAAVNAWAARVAELADDVEVRWVA